MPAGTTITWVVQNLSGATRTYRMHHLAGVTLTSGNTYATVANKASVTYTYTLNNALAPGAEVH